MVFGSRPISANDPSYRVGYAIYFMNEVENISFSNIISFRENAPQFGLAEKSKGMEPPEKIRIAVLDTGIDLDDKLIRAAGPRIKEKRGFVTSPESYSDNNGLQMQKYLSPRSPMTRI